MNSLRIEGCGFTNFWGDVLINFCHKNFEPAGRVDEFVRKTAGPELSEELRDYLKTIPSQELPLREIYVSKPYKIPNVKAIFHICVSNCEKSGQPMRTEEILLRLCYAKCLKKAIELDYNNIAFPVLGNGSFGYPKRQSFIIGIDTIMAFMEINPTKVLNISMYLDDETRERENHNFVEFGFKFQDQNNEGRPWKFKACNAKPLRCELEAKYNSLVRHDEKLTKNVYMIEEDFEEMQFSSCIQKWNDKERAIRKKTKKTSEPLKPEDILKSELPECSEGGFLKKTKAVFKNLFHGKHKESTSEDEAADVKQAERFQQLTEAKLKRSDTKRKSLIARLRKTRVKETAEKKEDRRSTERQRSRERKQNESHEEKDDRREAERLQASQRRKKEASEKTEGRKRAERQRSQEKRQNESADETEHRREADRLQKRLRRQEDSAQETENRREADRLQKRQRRQEEFASEQHRMEERERQNRRRTENNNAGWLSSEHGLNVEPHYLGPMNVVCEYCGALSFKNAKQSCCKKKIYHEPDRKLPDSVIELLIGDEKRSKDFRAKITLYNNLCAMGSINFSHVNVPRGIPITKVQGLIMHNYSHLSPFPGSERKYGQVYAYFDAKKTPEEAKKLILQGKDEDDIDIEVLGLLKKELLEKNQLVQQYRSMGDLMMNFESQNPQKDLPRKYMYIKDEYKNVQKYIDKNEYRSMYERIREDQAALLYEADTEGRPKGPGIWVNFKQGNKKARPLPHYHPLVDPLCYVLINFFGQPGYDYKSQDVFYKEPIKRFSSQLVNQREQLADAVINEISESAVETQRPSTEDIPIMRRKRRSTTRISSSSSDENSSRRRKRKSASIVPASTSREDIRQRRRSIRHISSSSSEDNNSPLTNIRTRKLSFVCSDEEEEKEETQITQQEIVPSEDEEGRLFHISESEKSDVDSNDGRIARNLHRSCILSSSDEDDVGVELENQQEDAMSAAMEAEFQRMFNEMGVTTRRAEDDSDGEGIQEFEEQQRPQQTSRKKQSTAEYYNYKLQLRERDIENKYHPICSTGKLGQLFVCDAYMRILEQRHDFARKKRVEKRATTEAELEEAVRGRTRGGTRPMQTRQFIYRNRRARNAGCELGAQVFSTPQVTGSAQYYRSKMEDAMCIVHHFGKPDLFVTYTGNPNWPEISENLLPKQKWTDAPTLVVQVFRAKMLEFLDDVIKKGGFGKVIAYAWSVEFQKRGMPHVHLLLTLEQEWKLDTAEKIDNFIWARIPEPPEDASERQTSDYNRLKEIVMRHQVHTPCEDRPNAYCRETTKNPKSKFCGKHFPHPFNNYTKLGEKGYAEPWRPEGVEELTDKRMRIDNRWIVSYCAALSLKYETHINVECCTNVLVCKYIYKYLYKGTSKVLVEFVDAMEIDCGSEKGAVPEMRRFGHNVLLPKVLNPNPTQIAGLQDKADKFLTEIGVPKFISGRPTVLYDELAVEEQMMCVTAPEGAWGIAAIERTNLSHSVATLEVHRPKGKYLVLNPETDPLEVEEAIARGDYVSKIEAWFQLNRDDPSARDFTYPEAARHYLLSKAGHKWKFGKRRKQRLEKKLVRLRPVSPRFLETYAIRELTKNVKGATSFEDLRKVPNSMLPSTDNMDSFRVVNTYSEAAQARRLMNGEREWEQTMEEAVLYETHYNIRRIFASIMIFGNPTKMLPIQLWDKHLEELCNCGQVQSAQRRENLIAQALFHIENILHGHNLELDDFGLPQVNRNALEYDSISDEVRKELLDNVGTTFNRASSKVEHTEMFEQLNEDQKRVHNYIVEDVMSKKVVKLFAVLGSGGTGKTFLYKAIYHKLHSEGHNVAMVAHTGVAAQLLIDGSTVHRFFWIEEGKDGKLISKVKAGSQRAEIIRHLHCIIWDEVSMSDKHLVGTVDRLLKFLTGNKRPFGGKTVIVGGDFKQLLPVVPALSGPDIVDETILCSEVWSSFKKFNLTINVRAQEDEHFSNVLEEVGRGMHSENDRYPICSGCFPIFVDTESQIISWTFGNNRIKKIDQIRGACILATLNDETMRINQKILDMVPGPEQLYVGLDTPDETRGMQMPPEYFHNELDSNMPPYHLKLKVGCIVILLKNLNVSQGLCNGTRLTVERLHDNYVVCKFLDSTKTGEQMITRIQLRPKLKPGKPLYIRTQLPLRLAYSMTIHKAQGQTFDKMGIVLQNPPFAHGHLYTALSRVRNSKDLRIFTKDDKGETDTKHRMEYPGHNSTVELKNIVYRNVFELLGNE